jgi:hypothetical protein
VRGLTEPNRIYTDHRRPKLIELQAPMFHTTPNAPLRDTDTASGSLLLECRRFQTARTGRPLSDSPGARRVYPEVVSVNYPSFLPSSTIALQELHKFVLQVCIFLFSQLSVYQ